MKMKNFIRFSILFAIIFVLFGCARGYRTINPTRIIYSPSNNLDDIALEYRYDIFNDAGNKKIIKKEQKKNIKLVAVKITNNTDKVINIGGNAAFFNGNSMLYPLDAISIKKNLKQSTPSYLLYLLLSPLTLSVNGSDPFPIGLILGPAISGGNMLIASNANNNFYKELVEYDILHRDIEPGKTVFGLVGFRDFRYEPLSVKIIK